MHFGSKKDIFRFIMRIATWGAMIIFVAANAARFFEESTVTDARALEVEYWRPVFFAVSIAALVLGCLHGLFRAYLVPADCERTKERRILRIIFICILVALNSVMSFYLIELINNPWINYLQPIHILLGCGITLFFYLFFVFMTNSVSVGMLIGNIFFIVWAMVNYFVLEFRAIPFQWIDIASIRTAMNVAGSYSLHLTWQMVTAIACCTFACGFFLHEGIYHIFKKWPLKIVSRGIGIAVALVFWIAVFKTDLLADTGIWLRDWHPQYTYKLFGMESGFLAFMKATFPTAPEGYSAEKVEEIEEKAMADSSVEDDASLTVPDNIIVIMNESFSDFKVYPALGTSEEIMPFVDSLTENTQKGSLLVSVIGGTTANTEYEFLTGNSCLLSPTTVVYNSYIKQDQYSMARILKEQGYTAVALHPYLSNGWNRQIVYPRMGFDSFISLSDFSDDEKSYLRGYMTDEADYKKLIKIVESKEEGEKLFLFNVTMQNHGEYENEKFKSTVSIIGYNGESKAAMEQYESLIRISDAALKDLIAYFEEHTEEKTLICFFGDHQPAVTDEFLSYATGKEEDELTFEDQQLKYTTKYLFWANYDIPEKSGETLSANYLGERLLSLTGLERSEYQKYLENQRNEYAPAINAYGYLDTDGTMHSFETEDLTGVEWLDSYKYLIYNELTGGSARNASFFGAGDAG